MQSKSIASRLSQYYQITWRKDTTETLQPTFFVMLKLQAFLPTLLDHNLSRNPEGIPNEGKYYFNCSSSHVDKDKVTYYTNYNNELKVITPKSMSDDIINNTFNYPIVKHFSDFTIPVKQKIVEN